MRLPNNGDFVMNGEQYLLDTNAIIQLLKGNTDVASFLESADTIAVSIIAEMEYLSFSGLNEHDVGLYRALKSRVRIFDVPADDEIFTRMVVAARQKYGLKLPDAIIAATARKNDLTLLTADDHFKKLKAPWKVRFYKPI